MLERIVGATRAAGALALGRIGGDYRRWDKTPGHPVCDVDIAVDAFLRGALHDIDPHAGWLSEETADDRTRLACERVWIVDPIDGTRDYLRGRTGWAVSVALVDNGRPLIGVLSAPARHELWMARRGQGAMRNGETIRVAARSDLAGARVPADALAKHDRDLVAVAKPNSIALRIATVAAGEADLLATARWGHEWDIAAASLIAEEAGAIVTDALGAALAFNTETTQAYGLLISAPGIHAAAGARFGVSSPPPGRR